MEGEIQITLVLSPREEMIVGKFRNEVDATRQKLIDYIRDELAIHPRLFISSSGASLPTYRGLDAHPCMWRGCDEIIQSDAEPFCLDHGADRDGEYPNFSYKKVMGDG